MADDLRVNAALVIPGAELSERFSRSSGPGGQGVNTADSRVELSYDLAGSRALSEHLRQRAVGRLAPRLVDGVLTIAASEYRTQLANRKAARERLASLLRDAVLPPAPPRRKTKPSRGAQQRRLTEKKQRSEIKKTRRSTGD
ncbi:ribosome-associated protein [Crossiella equi]|uniref:Ribosome-associated protein n=1 Tax=Crossiella equi TaxID=130796 RepID=A0ABS5AQA5_9PSEU|nr:alternative ribosome rescue aminoacyl-tRNA hydrolase ArfB [Crossiella equi]MBP2478753.1 ribosome-associated protein [Crossiella equi]